MNLNTLFSELRSLSQQPPSREVWDALCDNLAKWPHAGLIDQAIPYALAHVDRWPETIERPTPAAWLDAALEGHDVPQLQLVRALSVNLIKHDHPQRLLNTPHLSGLTRLTITGSSQQFQGFIAKLNLPPMGRLSTLNLESIQLNEDDVRALAALALPHLRELSVLSAWLDDDSALAICQGLGHEALTSLKLEGNRFGPRFIAQFASDARFHALHTLSLSYNGLGLEGFEPITRAPHLSTLRSLAYNHTWFNDDCAEALATSSHLPQLTALALAYNELTYAGVSWLARAPQLAALSELDLDQNEVGVKGVKAITASPYLTQLTKLSLHKAGITPAAAKALAKAPSLANLTTLRLEPKALGKQGRAYLATSDCLSEPLRAQWR